MHKCSVLLLSCLTPVAVNILFETRIMTQENAERVSFAMSRQAGITHLKEITIRLAENGSDPKCVVNRRSEFHRTVVCVWHLVFGFPSLLMNTFI